MLDHPLGIQHHNQVAMDHCHPDASLAELDGLVENKVHKGIVPGDKMNCF